MQINPENQPAGEQQGSLTEQVSGSWYLFAQGNIEGPVPVAQLLSNKELRPDALITCDGFRQWYRADDMKELWHFVETLSPKKAAPSAEVVKPNLSPAPAPAANQQSDLWEFPPLPTHTQKAAPVAAAADPQKIREIKTMLRLGENRSAVKTLLEYTLTGRWLCWRWLDLLSLEIENHVWEKLPVSDAWLKIPVGNFLGFYALGFHIRAMEKQNQYSHTKPWLGCLLAIFPPLALAYFQSAVNHHWRLHTWKELKQKL